MTIRALYIDGQTDKSHHKLGELLHVPDKFECESRQAPGNLDNFAGLISEVPDVLMIDSDLSARSDNGNAVSYSGITLAAEVRMHRPSRPIILIAGPHEIREPQITKASVDFDLIVYEDDVRRHSEKERKKIAALIDGFKMLESIKGQKWSGVLEQMGAGPDEVRLLGEAGPPVERKQWTIPQTARWIRNVIMRFPGILYDEITAATRLGISPESFRTPDMQGLTESCRYSGVFGSCKARWWRGRLFHKARELMLRHKTEGRLSDKFRHAFAAEFGEELAPAVCVADGKAAADWVCHILRKPVRQRNSIPYYPDNRPAVMDQARVSFKAVRESDDFDETLADADSYEIIRG